MISKSLRNVLNKNIALNQKTLIATPKRNMGGAKPPPNISSSVTDFDLVVVGKYFLIINMLLLMYLSVILLGGANATALTKFIQTDTQKYQMALVSNQGKYVLP